MATKHRGKAAQAAWAAKNGEKMRRAQENYSMESTIREAEADAQMIRETVAEAKRRGVSVAKILRERRG